LKPRPAAPGFNREDKIMFTSFDKALAAFFGSIISMITLLGYSVPEFFQGTLWTQITTVMLPSIIPFVLTWFARNKTA
jgi:hypothetical protein